MPARIARQARLTILLVSWLLLALALASVVVSYRSGSPYASSSWAISGGVLEIAVYDPEPLLGGIPLLGGLFSRPVPVPEGFSWTGPRVHLTLATYPTLSGEHRGFISWDFTRRYTWSRTALAVTFWPLPAAGLLVAWWLGGRDRRFVRDACPSCGYSMRGLLTARCPECGRESAHKQAPTPTP